MENITPLIVPVPPNFEQVMGYLHDRKWVAFYWTPYGDELEFDDGYSSGTIDWQGWLKFQQHKLVRPLLQSFDFGSSESDAVHWLLLDRQTRTFYVGVKLDVQQFLRTFISQMKIESVEISFDELQEKVMNMVKNMKRVHQSVTPDQIRDMLNTKQQLIEDMVTWLDNLYGKIVNDDR